MNTTTIRVRAVEGRMLPFIGADGIAYQGAFVGYQMRRPPRGTKWFDAIPKWDRVDTDVEVPDTPYYRRALERGDLTLAPMTPAPEAQEQPAQVEEPAPHAAEEVSK